MVTIITVLGLQTTKTIEKIGQWNPDAATLDLAEVGLVVTGRRPCSLHSGHLSKTSSIVLTPGPAYNPLSDSVQIYQRRSGKYQNERTKVAGRMRRILMILNWL